LPDAVCSIEMPGFVGDVAIEYVTSKYTDRDIAKKKAGFASYAFTFWVADNEHTAMRVRALTEERCSVLN